MSAVPSINITGLGAMRGDRVLFTGVSLSVETGQICVLRGANGSGKTTLLRLLAGLIPVEAGEITVNGAVHWLGHADGLKPHETPRGHLKHWASAWGSDADISGILSRNGVERAADVSATGLSAGQRRRTAFGRLQLTDRPIWLLDEPFSALDADGKDLIAKQISDHRDAGGVTIASAHGELPLEADQELML
ncbi:MAG: heme ABC exporter ATP-binding protein CcmA [Pseudomonadota bacterium]